MLWSSGGHPQTGIRRKELRGAASQAQGTHSSAVDCRERLIPPSFKAPLSKVELSREGARTQARLGGSHRREKSGSESIASGSGLHNRSTWSARLAGCLRAHGRTGNARSRSSNSSHDFTPSLPGLPPTLPASHHLLQ
jgi:hypothetical protein